MEIHVIGPRDEVICSPEQIVNTTSRSTNWSKGLSPFFLGPCFTYDGYLSKTVENLWQSSKVYKCHLDEDDNPSPEYFLWRNKICDDTKAQRYPMGKGAKPVYSFWNGEKISYIEARKRIYIPAYYNSVKNTPAFETLKMLCETSEEDMYLWDFDGYRHEQLGMSLDDVVNCEYKKMGHAFVLLMMLKGFDKYFK